MRTKQAIPILPSFEYLERYRNEGTRTYSSHAAYTEAADAYRPDSPQERFDLPIFEIPRDQMLVYTANPPADLAGAYLDDEKVRFATGPVIALADNARRARPFRLPHGPRGLTAVRTVSLDHHIG